MGSKPHPLNRWAESPPNDGVWVVRVFWLLRSMSATLTCHTKEEIKGWHWGCEFISLGCFCAVSHAFQLLGLKKNSYPFDWVRSPMEGIMHCLDSQFQASQAALRHQNESGIGPATTTTVVLQESFASDVASKRHLMTHQMKNLCAFSVFHSVGGAWCKKKPGAPQNWKKGVPSNELINGRGRGRAVPLRLKEACFQSERRITQPWRANQEATHRRCKSRRRGEETVPLVDRN